MPPPQSAGLGSEAGVWIARFSAFRRLISEALLDAVYWLQIHIQSFSHLGSSPIALQQNSRPGRSLGPMFCQLESTGYAPENVGKCRSVAPPHFLGSEILIQQIPASFSLGESHVGDTIFSSSDVSAWPMGCPAKMYFGRPDLGRLASGRRPELYLGNLRCRHANTKRRPLCYTAEAQWSLHLLQAGQFRRSWRVRPLGRIRA